MSYIPRHVEIDLQRLLQEDAPHRDVILIEGARQVGKTTLVEHVLGQQHVPFISLNLEKQALLRSRIDETREFAEFEQLLGDELDFDPGANCVLFIDEAQESLKLGAYVRFMKESWRGARVILSGSTLTRLFRGDARYPVGRVKRLVLRPFTFTEFLRAMAKERLAAEIMEDPTRITPTRHEHLLELLDQYLIVGGLPEIVKAYAAGGDWRHRRSEIFADYEQDFLRIFGEDLIAVIKGCLRSVANHVGSPSKNSSVIPEPTNRINEQIKRVFARLESWRLILHSEQRRISPEASHRYLPKRYLFDTGILRQLREKAVPTIRLLGTLNAAERRPLGGIVENQLAIELMNQTGELAGWKKTPAGLEIDFVMSVAERTFPIECKAIRRTKKTHLRGLFAYLDLFKQNTALVVSFAPFEVIEGRNGIRIINVPLYLAEQITEILRSLCGDQKLRF